MPLNAQALMVKNEGVGFCSKIDFSQVTWPEPRTSEQSPNSSTIPINQRLPFEIALNVIGSYEGDRGWGSVTNSFDGQGFSLGILNQNLGQGTLQPMLIELRDQHPGVMQAKFSPGHLTSVLQMLKNWEGSKHFNQMNEKNETGDLVGIGDLNEVGDVRFSPLDFEKWDLVAEPRNLTSVNWARGHLYQNGQFKPDWRSEFSALGQTPEYITIQVKRASVLHQLVNNYLNAVQIQELRAYMMIFDTVVQNGGFHTGDIQSFISYRTSHPKALTADLLKTLLALRLRAVSPRYALDVKQRKMAIIEGKGIVHGAPRNLEDEYCFSRLTFYR